MQLILNDSYTASSLNLNHDLYVFMFSIDFLSLYLTTKYNT